MKKGILGLLTWSLPFILPAQNNASTQSILTKEGPGMTENGIKWTQGLTWEQVKEKAKQENKYIFIDAYATWCGPCKTMDKLVYPNDTVGDFFNDKFISVKVQMDKTAKDDEQVKRWYADAASIDSQFVIEGYPTFIFLSPEGKIVEKQMGYKKVSDFLMLAKNAVAPGKVYDDPFAEYYKLVEQYKQGIKKYELIPYMIECAIKKHEDDFARQLAKEHTDYVVKLPKEKRYTKANIEMWTSFAIGSNTRIFQFFYKDSEMIDRAINKKGYARTVVDGVIKREIIIPFFKEQDSSIHFFRGMYQLDNGKLKGDFSEADWGKLEALIREKYDAPIAKRNVVIAKVEWYHRHNNFVLYVKYNLDYFNKYFSLEYGNPNEVNNVAYDAFMYTTDKKVIDGYIVWMKKVMDHRRTDVGCNGIDTYACLLYKAGRIEEAIQWEQKAVDAATGIWASFKGDLEETFEKMKKHEPLDAVLWGYR